MANATLYQQLLGPDFDRLPDVLQKFHGAVGGGRAHGVVTIHASGGLHTWVARCLGLPPRGDDVPVRLQVIPEGKGERWLRYFGSHCVESFQWQEDDFLLEQAGPLVFVFQVGALETGLTFEAPRNRLHGFRVPEALSLGVTARAIASVGRWNINVGFHVPMLGTVTTYTGEIRPLEGLL